MATFTILSWNVETFGEKKVGGILGYIAAVVRNVNADLVLFLEGTKYAQSDLARDMRAVLEATTGQSWGSFGSDPTGKSAPLPPVITYAQWPKLCEWASYWPTLSKVYDDDPFGKRIVLKSGRLPPVDEDWAREALELAAVMRKDIETYTAVFRYDPVVWAGGQGALVALGSYVALDKTAPGQLISFDATGAPIGYQSPTSIFTGRSPYLINAYFATPGNLLQPAAHLPIALFHAPFGGSGDLAMRVKANVGLQRLWTRAGPGTAIDLAAQPQAIVVGDFNVDYDWNENFGGLTNPVANTASWNAQFYGSYYAANFRMGVPEKTSLISIGSANPAWTNPLLFRANAYDNVIVKGIGGSQISAGVGGAIDLVADTFAHAGNYLAGVPGIPATPSLYDAFLYYRTAISDHLPVRCTLTVPTRP